MCESREDATTASDTAPIDRDDRIRGLRGAWSRDGLATNERRRERDLEERRTARRSVDRP